MDNKNVYFITGGGTGGHIYPAIAIADGLIAQDDTKEIYYVGNPNNMEYSIVKDKLYTFLPVLSSGMPRKLSFSFCKWIFQMIKGWLKCCNYIKKYKPKVVFGTGGYVSAPVLFAAITMRVPFVMHDCDANPGLVTRLLAPCASSVSVAFESAKSQIKNKKCYVNGNPIRNKFSYLTKEIAKKDLGFSSDKITLCVMGGSQGAKRINAAILELIPKLVKDLGLQVIVQTGKKNYDEFIENLNNIYPSYSEEKALIVKPYFDDMITALKASDIAVSRAGSLSISELCASSAATIFIPYAYAAADHQRKNARYMVQMGAGMYLEDSDANSNTILKMICSLINNPQQLSEIKYNASKLAKYDAAEKIINQIKECI